MVYGGSVFDRIGAVRESEHNRLVGSEMWNANTLQGREDLSSGKKLLSLREGVVWFVRFCPW